MDLPKLRDDDWFVFHQWHQSSPESPPLALELKPGTNNVLMISVRWAEEGGKQHRKLAYHELPLGKWTDFVVKWHFGPEGEAGVWMNGEPIFTYTGPIGYPHVADKLIDEKFGLYRKGMPAPAAVEYQRVRTGATFEEVTR